MLSDRGVTLQSVPPAPDTTASCEAAHLACLGRSELGATWAAVCQLAAADAEQASPGRRRNERFWRHPDVVLVLAEFRRRMVAVAEERERLDFQQAMLTESLFAPVLSPDKG